MVHKIVAIALITSTASFFGCGQTQDSMVAQKESGGEEDHWAYHGANGPSAWPTLNPEFSDCGEGLHQSPIDLANAEAVEGSSIQREYLTSTLRIAHREHLVDVINNGHTIQVTYDEGSTLEIDGTPYDLKQFHFHTPSEHTVEGIRFAMEMHFVHATADGQLAVLGVLFLEGEENPVFRNVIMALPDSPGDEAHFDDVIIDVDEFFPLDNRAYRYQGSLTTPPCSESVIWLVALQPVEISAAQAEEFSRRLGDNHRPIQSINDRNIQVVSVQ